MLVGSIKMDPYALNAKRGRGAGSRMAVSTDELPEGWTFQRISPKRCVWIDDRGKRYKSSLAVRAALARSRVRESGVQSETLTETDTDSEYQPSPAKKQKRDDLPVQRYSAVR